jgi:hypothetical protein
LLNDRQHDDPRLGHAAESSTTTRHIT